jgi:hypothetical protein
MNIENYYTRGYRKGYKTGNIGFIGETFWFGKGLKKDSTLPHKQIAG